MVQIAYQIKYRLHRAKYVEMWIPRTLERCQWLVEPIARPTSWNGETGEMSFLNIADSFDGWNNKMHDALWAYNLNYMDWLNQSRLTVEEGTKWINRFVEDIHYNNVGLDPYPTALRCINWVKFVCKYHEELDAQKLRRWNNSLYSQYRLLERRLEYHLLGNHLLEDAYSLAIGAIYLADKRMWRKSAYLLRRELTKQILADGAHYEQSPMYHCIMLDRLLDVYNFSTSNMCFEEEQNVFNDFLKEKAVRMLGHLESITYQDGSFPLFNDAANDIAPTPSEIKDYAKRLGLTWRSIALKECGYRHLQVGCFEAFVDVGGITASYQPGHSHADALNYELRIDGKPFVVDTGISTYDKNARRQYERSTVTHNTVTVDGNDSAEVWGGFRVGKRSKITIKMDQPLSIAARCSGVKKEYWHKRKFTMDKASFSVSDIIASNAEGISRIHLSSEIVVKDYSDTVVSTDIASINIKNATKVVVKGVEVSTSYNKLMKAQVVEIHFKGNCKYEIEQR